MSLEATKVVSKKKTYIKDYSVPIKWMQLHTGTDFPGALTADSTLSPIKQPGVKLYLNPGETYVVCAKGREFALPLAAVKNSEIDLDA